MGKVFSILVATMTLISAYVVVNHIWWLPPDISTLGVGIDHQLSETMVSSGLLFVVSQLVLAAFVWRFSEAKPDRPIKTFPGGATPLVIGAVVLVGIEILMLSMVGTKVWASIYVDPPQANAIRIDALAEQFAFYFRYPGADGKFGAMHPDLISDANNNFYGLDPANDTSARDDIVSATLAVPVDRPIYLSLHAKDVSHSFYVPELRVQQDFVPGLVIPLHFTANQIGRHEIVCTQLCGLGHYSMRAFIDIMTAEKYQKWLQEQAAQQ